MQQKKTTATVVLTNEKTSYPKVSKSLYPVLDSEKVYKIAHNLEFSINYANPTNNSKKPIRVESGTAWLFDYAKNPDKNFYKLFLATNFHVLSNYFNKESFRENKINNYYKKEFLGTNKESLGFSIGRSPDSFNLPDKNQVKFFSNSKVLNDFLNKKTANQSTYGPFFRNPQIIFAANNIFTVESLNKYATYWEQIFWENKNQFINQKFDPKNYFVDFAVLSLDINLDSDFLQKSENKLLKTWILDALNQLNDFKKNRENYYFYNLLPGKTMWEVKTFWNLEPKIEDKNFFYQKKSPVNYIAGYPLNYKSQPVSIDNIIDTDVEIKPPFEWVRNDFYIGQKNFKILQEEDFESTISQPVFSTFLEDNYKFYGISRKINNNFLKSGSSGSLVFNNQGYPMGIYWGKIDTLYSLFIPLVANNYFVSSKFWKNMELSYNLIDNYENSSYQVKSYRQALQEIFPDGIFRKKNTFLFTTGY